MVMLALDSYISVPGFSHPFAEFFSDSQRLETLLPTRQPEKCVGNRCVFYTSFNTQKWNAEPPGRHSHAEHGNDQSGATERDRSAVRPPSRASLAPTEDWGHLEVRIGKQARRQHLT